MPKYKIHSKQKFLHKAELYRFDMPYGIKFDYQPIQPSIAPHSHAFIEIFYILDGKINHNFNGVPSTLTTGDFALIDCGQIHHFSKIDNEKCSVINILFYPSFIDSTLSDAASFKEILSSNVFNTSNIPPDFLFNQVYHEDNNTIKNLILTMQHEFFSCEFEYLKILKLMLTTLLTYILRYMIGKSILSAKTSPIDMAVNYIHTNYFRNITLDEISNISNYSPQHFCRKFKSVTGYTFSEYLQKTRIDYSCRLLQHTNMKVTEIANAVGYSDLHHFELLFRKYINRTPTEHRNFFKKASISHLLQI